MPIVAPEYEVARQRGLTLINMLPAREGGFASFIPPSSIFHNVGGERAVQYAVTVLQLWPYILRRVTLARSDPKVRPLTTKMWRGVLGGEYWKNLWPKDKRDNFSATTNYWRYGSEAIFGTKFSADIRQGQTPRMGRLLCRCNPSLDHVKAHKSLLTDVVAGLVQWEHLLQLASLASSSIAALGIPSFEDHGNTICLPDFFETDRDKNNGVLKLIKKIVLNGQDVPSSGWPPLFNGWEIGDEKPLRKWLPATRDFFLNHASHRDIFDKLDDWMHSGEIRRAQIASLRSDKLDPLSQELHARYFVSCLLQGQWEPEVHAERDGPADGYLKCGSCSQLLRLGEILPPDYDLSDEE
jgi:hypothetical protein